MSRIELPNKWNPRPDQDPLWRYLHGGGKRAVEVAHRRWGKDDVSLHWTACAAHERIGVYWHMLPKAEQARKAIWTAVNPKTGKLRIDEAFPLEIRRRTNNTEMSITFKCGSLWQVVGSDSYNNLVGSPPIGIVNSEYALANPSAWAYLSPILEENNGWSIFIYTSRGKNHGHALLKAAKNNPKWFAEVITAEQSPVFSTEQLAQIRFDLIALYGEDIGDAMYRQEYLCSFDAAVIGAVYATWIEKAERAGRVGVVNYDPSIPVITIWDLGYGDATAIWFAQVLRNEIRVIDYYENNGKDIKHYCDVIKEKPYKYSHHWGPHDASHQLLAAGGRSVMEIATDEGVPMFSVNATGTENGRQALRKSLPNMWFDEKKCEKGLEAIRSYHFAYNDKTKRFGDEPVHDWSSHAAKALELLGRVWQNPPEAKPPPKPKYEIRADEQGRITTGFSIGGYLREKERSRDAD